MMMRLVYLGWLAAGIAMAGCGASAPEAAPATRPAAATAVVVPGSSDYAEHVRKVEAKLKQEAPEADFAVLVEKPFVVIGDGGEAAVRTSAERTVKWAVTLLKKDFFEKDPGEILDVYLFEGKESYDRYTKQLFGDTPTTPYGYYSPAHKALIMNIGTGGGTLVHEIVHPYMAANFPACPAWFNEGMGSLFEQSAERGGHIVGLTNWRLAGLQAAIRGKKILPWKKLMGTSTSEFYGDTRGVNYAEARYLLYWLQEKGLLREFYAAFVKGQKEDPTGWKTLYGLLKEKEEEMRKVQEGWETWVMGLRFP